MNWRQELAQAEVYMPRWAWWLLPGAVLGVAMSAGPFLRWFLDDHHGFDTWFLLAALTLYLIIYGIVLAITSTLHDVIKHAMHQHRINRPPPWELCRKCGYNLIASRDRCPECGQAIPPWPVEQPRIRLVRGFVIVRRRRGD